MSAPPPGSFPPDEENPWTTRSTRVVYENPWIRVEENQVIRPDGEPGIYGVVYPSHVALGVVPIEASGHIWLVGQHRYPLGRYSWEIPEGGGNPAADLRQEAARELREETGLTASRWEHLIDIHTSNCFTAERAVIFLARDLTPGEALPEGCERLQLARIPFGEAVDAVTNGRITDGVSVAGILAAARRIDG